MRRKSAATPSSTAAARGRARMHLEETELVIDGEAVATTVRINRRARRLIVRVDRVERRVIVTAPSLRAAPSALEFARTRSAWIAGQLAGDRGPRPFGPGVVFPLMGVSHQIINTGSARTGVRLGLERTVQVGGAREHVNRRVCDFLRREAKALFCARSDHFAERLGVRRGAVTIRDIRSRWGSCSATGALSYSWRLILAPQEIIDYVAAHECAHLLHLNHSPAFWRTVKSLGVDPMGARDWFAVNGTDLLRWGVTPRPPSGR